MVCRASLGFEHDFFRMFLSAVHFIAPSRDPLAKFQKCFSVCFVVKESRKTMPRDYDAGARLGLCTLSPEDWAFFENVQYILDLIGGARAVRRILQLKPVQVLSESAVSR
ncbi:hypothetical protein EVAR_102214_1 [Eumeta japonica]|uniref:Uncharacterized protein n=1 Tax=Eumeta variegata TaxID=151549 RepID=A0A4C1WDT1_EUMVA|nr:hypothetical protein EVAR_102214_1 [Eumeta japonica]